MGLCSASACAGAVVRRGGGGKAQAPSAQMLQWT